MTPHAAPVSGSDGAARQAEVLARLRGILADLTGTSDPLTADPDTPLLREGIGLDSLGGAMLLTRVRLGFGVDVAEEDLNLDSLTSIGTLAGFLAARIADGAAVAG